LNQGSGSSSGQRALLALAQPSHTANALQPTLLPNRREELPGAGSPGRVRPVVDAAGQLLRAQVRDLPPWSQSRCGGQRGIAAELLCSPAPAAAAATGQTLLPSSPLLQLRPLPGGHLRQRAP